MPSAGDSIIWIEMDTLSDYIWRTSYWDQIFSIYSSCARLASSYWDPEVEIWRRIWRRIFSPRECPWPEIQYIESPAKSIHLNSIIWIETDTLSDYIWRTSDQIFSIDSSCARLASSYWKRKWKYSVGYSPGQCRRPEIRQSKLTWILLLTL